VRYKNWQEKYTDEYEKRPSSRSLYQILLRNHKHEAAFGEVKSTYWGTV